jgi:putative acetyltransferase
MSGRLTIACVGHGGTAQLMPHAVIIQIQEFKMIIRNETNLDIAAISEVTIAAFRNIPISNHTEQFIINALRCAHALTISLVAEVGGQVAGHIAFSPVTISNGSPNWYGLGPISVLPEHQKRGIGKSLVNEGLSLLKSLGSKGCALVGDPGYYQRFGFKNIPGLIYDGIPQEFFLALPFDKEIPLGTVVFHEGFSANG